MKISREELDLYEYIDFHTHMHDQAFDSDSVEVMRNILDKKILCLTIGTDIEESRRAKELADKYENVYYTIGVHPHDKRDADFIVEDFQKLLSDKCLAIGECGLDYYYLESDRENGLIENMDREVDRQQELFIKQIDFAMAHYLPLMIHGRCSTGSMDAYEDIIYILKKYKVKYGERLRGNIHFYAGDIVLADQFMSLGFTFSFGGVLTLTSDYDEVVRHIPLEYIHAETDSPYVTPKDVDGKKIMLNPSFRSRNSSENIDRVVERIAELKGLGIEHVKSKLKNNFLTFVNI